jgi:hypothetical protein
MEACPIILIQFQAKVLRKIIIESSRDVAKGATMLDLGGGSFRLGRNAF